MSNKVSFKFLDTDKCFSTQCQATSQEREELCHTIRMYKSGCDTRVVIDTKKPTEITIVAPTLVNDTKTLDTLCVMGKTFCEICKFNMAKSKQK